MTGATTLVSGLPGLLDLLRRNRQRRINAGKPAC
jgi:hypothetical protein